MKVGIEQIRFFEDIAKKQHQIWNDSADYGIVLDGKDDLKTEIRENLQKLIETFEVEIEKSHNYRMYTFFAAFEQEDGWFLGTKCTFYYSKLERPYKGILEIFSVYFEHIRQKEHGWKV
jgi:hypothetical protein